MYFTSPLNLRNPRPAPAAGERAVQQGHPSISFVGQGDSFPFRWCTRCPFHRRPTAAQWWSSGPPHPGLAPIDGSVWESWIKKINVKSRKWSIVVRKGQKHCIVDFSFFCTKAGYAGHRAPERLRRGSLGQAWWGRRRLQKLQRESNPSVMNGGRGRGGTVSQNERYFLSFFFLKKNYSRHSILCSFQMSSIVIRHLYTFREIPLVPSWHHP